MKAFWLAAAAASVLATAALPALAAGDPLAAPRMGPWGFDAAGQDRSASPGQDFFDYANGTYVRNQVIPADRSSYGAFDGLRELSVSRMRAVLEKAAADKTATGDTQKIGALYRSFMDEATVEALGARPIAGELEAIRAARTREDIARLMGQGQTGFGGAVFAAFMSDDAKDPLRYAVYLTQAGLTLPNRDYYLDAKFAEQKAKYEAYVAQMLTLAGWTDPAASAKAIVAMETEIAEVSWTAAQRRDRDTTYNATTPAQLAADAPGFPWKPFLEGAGLGQATRLVVRENTALPKIAAIFARTPVETLKAYQAFNMADQAAPYLSKAFDQAHYEFREKTITGQLEQRPRWKRGVTLVDDQIGEALGKL
ncbi:MAG TPA: M13 family metallopeptidase N-terminal domain-containing protein, partial [Phenylobacterium sp.]|nr:M13 family metallopeptidase N-terminal domain-containing protein [Phenylobacterium sp.]